MTPAQPLVLVVAAALLDSDGRVLIAQRPAGKAMAGLWEFPGGKIEVGESPEDALVRELREELGIAVKPPCLAPFTFASHTYENFRLLMPLYVCRRWDGTPTPLQHVALKWLRPRELMARRDEFPMPAADLPLLPMLRDLL
jgi:8-oxo-dGTP diphosphatase